MTSAHTLNLVGGILQVGGITTVGYEILRTRRDELGVPAPWHAALARWRRAPRLTVALGKRLLDRARGREVRHVSVRVEEHGGGSSSAMATVTHPTERDAEPTTYADLQRLRTIMGEDMARMERFAVEQDKRQAEAIRTEIANERRERLERLRPELRRQTLGVVVTLVGIVLQTWAGLIG